MRRWRSEHARSRDLVVRRICGLPLCRFCVRYLRHLARLEGRLIIIRRIEIHAPDPVCRERDDWIVLPTDGDRWHSAPASELWPLPAGPLPNDALCHVSVAWIGPQLPPAAAAELGRLCRALMAAYGLPHPHLHCQRGPARSPVAVEAPSQLYPGGRVTGIRGLDAVHVAGHAPAALPRDCPPWELPGAFWDALYPG